MRNLACDNQLMLLLVILRKSVTNNWVHLSPGLVSRDGGRVGAVEIA